VQQRHDDKPVSHKHSQFVADALRQKGAMEPKNLPWMSERCCCCNCCYYLLLLLHLLQMLLYLLDPLSPLVSLFVTLLL
jgi:hypothetical protein